MEYLLRVEDLKTSFYTDNAIIKAVDGVSFDVRPGEILGVVGESGCGKSVVSLSIMRLVMYPPGKIEAGRVLFNGRDLLSIDEKSMRRVRGNEIAMIFQEPMTSFNPVYQIGDQVSEVIRLHQGLGRAAAWQQAAKMLELVGIPRPSEVLSDYPHQLSGGMRQRVMIAMALSCNPKLLIADEPTTALDVTIQAQILELMKDLREKINTAIIFITHDLGVIAEMAQHVVVMYSGKVVENAEVNLLFNEPLHPYTVGLMNSKPKLEDEKEILEYIPGMVPNPMEMPEGCAFHPRCQAVMDLCRREMPALIETRPQHLVRCWLYQKEKGVA
ncbi:MAG TPA: ABC transporter ATP-binding protein [Candidatus Limnocylindrales bacterium]|nr:ABC transporter ATP-binding protein [Candidatus Limnocylindrales bacterium]